MTEEEHLRKLEDENEFWERMARYEDYSQHLLWK